MGRGQIGLGRGNGGRVCFGVCVCCCEEVEESLMLADFVWSADTDDVTQVTWFH